MDLYCSNLFIACINKSDIYGISKIAIAVPKVAPKNINLKFIVKPSILFVLIASSTILPIKGERIMFEVREIKVSILNKAEEEDILLDLTPANLAP
jgi:uncharacterized membrane protein